MSAKTELRGGSFLVSLMCAASSKYTDDPPKSLNDWYKSFCGRQIGTKCLVDCNRLNTTTNWNVWTEIYRCNWSFLSNIELYRVCSQKLPTLISYFSNWDMSFSNPLQSIAQRHDIVTPKQIEKWNLTSSSDDLRFHCFGWFLYIYIIYIDRYVMMCPRIGHPPQGFPTSSAAMSQRAHLRANGHEGSGCVHTEGEPGPKSR